MCEKMTAMALQIVELLRLKYVSRQTVCDTGENFIKSTRLYNGPVLTMSTKWQKESRWTA